MTKGTAMTVLHKAAALAIVATGLCGGLSARAQAPAEAVRAVPFAERLTAWADRLDQAAVGLESAPAAAQTPVGPGALLKKGTTDERVSRLSQRLVELGFLTAEQRTTYFDDLIENAVKGFQTTQGLRPDGLVGEGTRAALDRTPLDAARVMRQTAVSMRALRDERLPMVLLVNLPSQTVTLVRGGTETLSMRAVVGRPSRETPLLRDQITHVIVNPTWTVPPTVLKEDKLPLLRSKGSPGISNAIVYLDGEPVEPQFVDWSAVTPGRVRIVQQPGDHNALGRFRFNLTNPYNIYLHGTNEPRLFNREVRTISSGCVRLEDARLMAETLLNPQGVNTQRIDRLLTTAEPQWVKLAHPVPVRFTYWMATVAEDGSIRLHPDVYDMADEPARSPASGVKEARATLSPA